MEKKEKATQPYGSHWCGKVVAMLSLILALSFAPQAALPVVAQGGGTNQIVLKVQNERMSRVLKKLEKVSGYKISYVYDDLEPYWVSVDIRTNDIHKAIKAVLGNHPVGYRVQGKKIIVSLKEVPGAGSNVAGSKKRYVVKGRVTDENGDGMISATVMIHGTTQGTTTDMDGRYSIEVRPTDVLDVSYLGFNTEQVPVKGKETLNVQLTPSHETLDETTVVAYGNQRSKSVIGAVSSVRAMDLKSSNSDLTSSMIGKVPGMLGYQMGGLPAALTEEDMNTKFYIRGITSFQTGANTEPLILLDGVESSKLDLARMQPEDIESFTVMKDASATAMYGARGANGVILVTTKKGTEGSVFTTTRYECILSEPTSNIDVVDGIDYMRYYNQALIARSPGSTPKYSVERINRTASGKYPNWLYPNNDWYNMLFKKQTVNHHAGLSIRGGSKIVQYYASINFNHDTGMLKADRLNDFDPNISNNQFQYRTNLNIDLNSGIKLVINSTATLDRMRGPYGTASGFTTRKAYEYAFYASPVDFAPIYPDDGNYSFPHIRFGTTSAGFETDRNPYALVQQGYSINTRFSSTNRAEYIQNLSRWIKGLEIRLSASLVQSSTGSQGFTTTPYYYYLIDYNQETGKFKLGADGKNSYSTRTLNAGDNVTSTDQRVTYQGSIYHTAAWGNHQTSFVGVAQMYERTFSPIDDVLEGQPQRNLTFSGRFSYGYKDRYFVEASAAYNGSERFAKNNRFGFFPSLGGAWVVSDEKFMKPLLPYVSFLKMRLSWGKVGNDGVISTPRFVYLEKVGQLQDDAIAAMRPDPGSALEYFKHVFAYANPNIQWEVAEDWNLGIETKLFRGLFEAQLDIYRQIRHNIISQRFTIPADVGIYSPPLANIGKTLSQGFDLSAKFQHAFTKDLWMILTGTLTYNKVTFKEIEEAPDKPAWQRKKGREISQQMGYIAEGLFKDQADIDNSPRQDGDVMPGDIKYRDINGDNVIDVQDAVFIGYPTEPRLVYGTSLFVNYKNLEFNCSFQGSGKRTFFIDPVSITPFYKNHSMLRAIADSHWTDENQDIHAFWPRLSTNAITDSNPYEARADKETRYSTYFMRECSFLRCTAISLAYSLPKKWLKPLGLGLVKVTFAANNPFLFSNFKLWDVELGTNGFNYPIQKTYSVGLNVNF